MVGGAIAGPARMYSSAATCLGRSRLLASRSLSFPLLTCVYQAHARPALGEVEGGRGCLPFTREAGVDGIPLARYHLPAWICSYENQTTLRQAQGKLFAAQPPPLRVVSSEQVAHNRLHTDRCCAA